MVNEMLSDPVNPSGRHDLCLHSCPTASQTAVCSLRLLPLAVPSVERPTILTGERVDNNIALDIKPLF